MTPRARRRPTLLVVDDEARILTAMQRTLRREGYDILVADTPAEGLRLLEEQEVDLVLSDHKMPGMTGVEFLAQARARRPGAPRLLVTGWTDPGLAERLPGLDIAGLIPKPWDDAELKRTLRRALAQAGRV